VFDWDFIGFDASWDLVDGIVDEREVDDDNCFVEDGGEIGSGLIAELAGGEDSVDFICCCNSAFIVLLLLCALGGCCCLIFFFVCC